MFQCLAKSLPQCNLPCLLTSEHFDFARQALKKGTKSIPAH